MHVLTSLRSHSSARLLPCIRNSVCMLSAPGALPCFGICRAVVSSSCEKVLERSTSTL